MEPNPLFANRLKTVGNKIASLADDLERAVRRATRLAELIEVESVTHIEVSFNVRGHTARDAAGSFLLPAALVQKHLDQKVADARAALDRVAWQAPGAPAQGDAP